MSFLVSTQPAKRTLAAIRPSVAARKSTHRTAITGAFRNSGLLAVSLAIKIDKPPFRNCPIPNACEPRGEGEEVIHPAPYHQKAPVSEPDVREECEVGGLQPVHAADRAQQVQPGSAPDRHFELVPRNGMQDDPIARIPPGRNN